MQVFKEVDVARPASTSFTSEAITYHVTAHPSTYARDTAAMICLPDLKMMKLSASRSPMRGWAEQCSL